MNWTPELLYLIHCFGVIGLACFTIAGLCGAVLSVRDVPPDAQRYGGT